MANEFLMETFPRQYFTPKNEKVTKVPLCVEKGKIKSDGKLL
jgi:hypothetical protein